ncbi:MAG: hypothetical protein SFY80_04200 [Verrucomicrobiota bacterium]|nr:hypothetical protein [Verrucomicrobiota bacterium]
MAGFDEHIVREYFELHGFLVRQLRKYQVQSRKKLAEEEIDLLVYNPAYRKGIRAPEFMLSSSELPQIHRAMVVIKGWHSYQRFTPTMLANSSEILQFLEKNVLKTAEQFFPDTDDEFAATGDLLKILVLPGLPTQEPHHSETIRLLRERGVDGVLSFRSMLRDIIAKVETNLNYQKSEILQIIRLLKNYDLIKDPQLELGIGEKAAQTLANLGNPRMPRKGKMSVENTAL